MKKTNYTISLNASTEIAREIVVGYYESLIDKEVLNVDGFRELMSIKYDKDNKVLLEHIKAIRNIMDGAIKEIEETKGDDRKWK